MDRIQDAASEVLSSARGAVSDDQGKLVSAVAGDEVLSACNRAHDPGPQLEHQVPMLVADLVVHRLEMIEIDEEHREGRGSPLRPRERRRQPPPELARVGKAGHAVGGCLPGAAVVADRIGDRDGRAAGEGRDREQVLVGERPLEAGQAQQGGDAIARRDRYQDRPSIRSKRSLPCPGHLGKPVFIEELGRGGDWICVGPACSHVEALLRHQDQAPVIRECHLHGVLDHEPEHVLDVSVADHRHAELAQ
ncbi:MAG: hypothetical protein M3082_22650 [Candidatus Dormibacteraeota bacterium]|nr:hypothetical protein [Candidatus Dormibacteraeota bacterium]